MSGPASPIDVAGLLTIDVGSELRKLAQAQLQGPWQLPTELVRRALRHGASAVEVQLHRNQVRVVDDGRGFLAETLQHTAILLDEGRSNEERHAALTVLESAGELALLALAGISARAISIETRTHGRGLRLRLVRGRPPELRWVEDGPAAGASVELVGAAIERKPAEQNLRQATRFCPATVRLDGRPLPRGFEGVIAQARLEPPLAGHVALPGSGDAARLWLLEFGLISGHISVPQAPCFEAVLELGSGDIDASAARLREKATPLVPMVVEQALDLVVAFGRRGPTLSEGARARAAELVLQCIQRRLRVESFLQLPVFAVATREGRTAMSLLQIRGGMTRAGDGAFVVPALFPDQKPERYALETGPVLIADATTRSRLSELLRVQFRPPDPKEGLHSLGSAVRRAWDRSRHGAQRWLRRCSAARGTKPLAPHELAPEEQRFLSIMRPHLLVEGITQIALCGGSGPIHRKGDGTLCLPRERDTVRAAMAAVGAEPKWAYPAALALLEGEALPPVVTRDAWRS